MIWNSKEGTAGPGEARTRERQRRQMRLFLGGVAMPGQQAAA